MTYTPYAIPISVKGIVFEDDKIWLRKNQRDEWELPGGKVDKGEHPAETVVRELREELGYDAQVADLLQAHIVTISDSIDEQNGVLVLTYLCKVKSKTGEMEHEGEAGKAEFQFFALEEVTELSMPQFYKDAIENLK